MTQMLLTSALCLRAASLPTGFNETPVPGPSAGNWNEAVGITFSPAGRMFVWNGTDGSGFCEASETNFTQLLDLSEEVADWGDHGCLGFTLDPNFSTKRLHLSALRRGPASSALLRNPQLQCVLQRIHGGVHRPGDALHLHGGG